MVVRSEDSPSDEGRAPVRVHEPVLLRESLAILDLAAGMTVVDGTVGAGGHASRIAQAIAPGGRLLGLDRDAEILQHAERALVGARRDSGGGFEFSLHRRSFAEIAEVLDTSGIAFCDRVFLDLGVSSLQLDSPLRGFSFMHDGPLDMRMDVSSPTTAASWLRAVRQDELERVLRDYGDERYARRIARAIVETRQRHPIERTSQLADLIARSQPAVPRHRQRIHPATRSFQAIRIAVNDELGALERGLVAARERLAVGGRLAVISFHSAEDRIVKRFVREQLEPVVRKPIMATEVEIGQNPRARSARLRCGIRRAS